MPIEYNLKKNVQEILQALGLNQSQIVVAFFKEIERTKKIPLSFDLNNSHQPDKLEQKAIDEFLANPELLGTKESQEYLDILRKTLD